MKPRLLSAARLSFPLASAIAALLAAPSLHAANGNWNVDALGNWSLATNWSSTPVVPGTVAGDVVGLNNNIAAARTVTIDTTGRTAGILNVGDSNNTHVFTLAASGGGTLTLNNSGSGAQINETGTQIDVISAPIILADNLAVSAAGSITLSTGGISETGGARTLTKSGAGLLTLSGANSYTGLTTISLGVLNIQNATALGTAAGGATVASGAALQIQNSITVGAEALSLSGTGVANDGALRSISGNNTFGGAVTLGTASRINSNTIANTLTLTGGITGTTLGLTVGGLGNTTVSSTGIATGSGTLTKDGGGTLTLAAANTYTGVTRVLEGRLAIATEAALYNGAFGDWTAANVYVRGGATLVLNGDSAGTAGFSTANLSTLLANLSVAGTAAEGLQAGSNVGIDTSTATGGTFTPASVIADSTGTFGGAIGLNKLGTNTLVLDLANTYTGPTLVTAGTLQLGAGGGTGSLSTSSAITVASGATFTVNQTDTVSQGTDFSGAPITGAGNFTQAGVGTTVLTAANTFTGTTTVSAGILQLDNALAIQNSALSTSGTGTVTLGVGVTTPNFGGVSGSTDIATVIPGYSSVTNLSLNPQSGSTPSYGGVISDGVVGMTLTKTGLGTQVLTGANTYTGTTIISSGTLTVGNALTGSLNGTTGTALTFTGTGTFNVSEAASSTQGMGALTLSAGDATVTSSAANALAAATLTFGSLAPRTAGGTGNFTLATNTISTGATPNLIVFTDTTNVPLAAGSNDPGMFFGGTSYARYDAAGYVRSVTYGTDTNANAVLSGPAVTTLGATTAATDLQFTGAARATTTSGVISSANTNTLAVTNGTLFAVGQILTGTNIAANTYIAGISGNTLTLTNAGVVNSIGTAVPAATVLTPYNSVTAQTTGSVNTLNLSGTGASLTLGSGQTLSVNGILRSGALTSGVISGGTGIQTVGSGGDLVVRTNLSTDLLTIASPILNNGGSSLTKSGAGTLLLSGANTYAGGTFLNGGTVRISNAASFGTSPSVTVKGSSQITASGGLTYANAITVNSGTTLTLLNPAITSSTAEFTGVLSGAGNLFLPNSGVNAVQGILAFTNTANTFTGNVVLSASGSGDEHFRFNSIGDGGNFTFAKNGNRQLITHTGTSDITFGTRQIIIAATMVNGGVTDRQGMDGGGSNPVSLFANDGTGTVTFNADMVVNDLTNAYGVLYFGGINSGNNTFAGKISDTSGAARFSIGKFGGGTWIFSGNNTYEGNILIAAGTLSVGTIANAATPQPLGIGPAIQLGVGNSGAAGTLLYTGGTASTDKQVQIGAPINTLNQAAAGSILNDGSGALTFTNPTFNPASTGVTATRTLTLGGSYAGGINTVQGVVQNNATGGVVALTKTGAGTWQLSGANTYTGATSLTGGTLILSGSNSSAGATTIGTGGGTLQLDSSSNGGLASGGLNLNSATAVIQALNADRSISNSVIMNGDLGSAPTFSGANSITLTGNLRVNNAAVTLTNNIDPGKSLTINTIDRDGSNSRNLTVEGTGQTTVGGAIALSGGSLTKNGAGAMTLSGLNTYTGNTVVTAGSLTLADNAQLSFVLGATTGVNNSIAGAGTVTLDGDFSINTAAADGLYTGTWILENVVTLAGAYGSSFTVSGFTDIGGDKWEKTLGMGAKTYTFDEVTGTLTLFTPDPFPAWALSKGLTGDPGLENGKGDDPDGDGFTNLDEFGFDGNPLSGANDGKIVGKIATVGPDQVMTLTLPVRNGATFGSDVGDQLSILVDGIYYRIEGSVDLTTFANTITEVTPTITAGLPSLSSGWTYRTFRAPGTVPTVPRTFLRAKVSETP